MNQTKTCKNNAVTAGVLYVREKDMRQVCTDGWMDGEGENLNQMN